MLVKKNKNYFNSRFILVKLNIGENMLFLNKDKVNYELTNYIISIIGITIAVVSLVVATAVSI